MTKIFTKKTRIHYPYVVEPVVDRWEVLFVETDRPYRTALFDEKVDAVAEADRLNHLWRASIMESRRLLAQVAERAAPPPASVAPASPWTRLKGLLRLR